MCNVRPLASAPAAAMILALLVLWSNLARAVEVLSAGELASHCQYVAEAPESADGEYCIRYIQGFMDGAVATDARVMLNAEAEAERSEGFTERAMRTRAPTRADMFRAARLAGFCVGDPLPLRNVVDVVVADLNDLDTERASVPAREVVYASLRAHYPCRD